MLAIAGGEEQEQEPLNAYGDPDDLRREFPRYTGANSWLFQAAISIWVNKMHDLAVDQKQTFRLDGTLSNLAIAQQNVQRRLGRRREITIHLDPPI